MRRVGHLRDDLPGRETALRARAHSGTVQGTGNPCSPKTTNPSMPRTQGQHAMYAGTRSPVLAEKARTCHDVRRARERGSQKAVQDRVLNLPES